ncbi:MAG: leucyl aminopeptidase [Ornithinimicrobium sp.]
MSNPGTVLSFSSNRATSIRCDVLVLAAISRQGKAVLHDDIDLPRGVRASIDASLIALGADGSPEELVQLTAVDKVAAPLVLVVGTGAADPASADAGPDRNERIRRAAGRAARSLTGKERAAFALGTPTSELATAAGQGALLGSYVFHTFYGAGKSATAKSALESAIVLGFKTRAREARHMVAAITAEVRAVNYARDLVNTPPNELYPESFATSVTRHAGSSVSVEIWDPERLATEGCGGLIGVGQGSARGPRLVTLRYEPKRPSARIALIGKGITFDSGGLCLKPATGMVTMKCDMGGAAAVAAAIIAIAEQQLPVAVTGYLCLAENMTGDLAQRPGDVVTMRGSKTVEIINTDAEGRLVMADGLALASEEKPDAIFDIATLTGACTIALGERTLGVMGKHHATVSRVLDSAATVGEPAWQLPLVEEIRAQMDSQVADVKHTGERFGGAMVAATFLAEFIGTDDAGKELPWAHLDIAGPAFNDKSAFGYTPKGGTGAGVRALIEVVRGYSAGPDATG